MRGTIVRRRIKAVVERGVAIVWMVMGASFFSFMIGAMSTFLNAIDNKGRIAAEKLMVINEFAKQANLDLRLKAKIKKALEYRTKKYYFTIFEKNSLLEGIPIALRYQVRDLNDRSLP